MKKPKTPKQLGASGGRLWRELVSTYRFDGPAELALLASLCEVADRLAAVRERLTRERLVTSTARGGARLHPLLRAEIELRDQLLRYARALRLHLWSDDHAETTNRA